MTRKQILAYLSPANEFNGYYTLLKECIKTKDDLDKIDVWFASVVKSIRNYQPNTKLLALVGKKDIGLTNFFAELLPADLQQVYAYGTNINEDILYNRMIVDFAMREKLLDYIKVYNFKCSLPVDKRMCSYCTTWNSKWHFPQRKNVIVINIDNIDWLLFNIIDKRMLWIEIFKKF